MAGWREAKREDIYILAPKMRESDKLEVYCSHGMTAEEALEYSWLTSREVNTIYGDDEEVIGMFGWSLDESNFCIPWLLASDELKNHQKQFIKESRKWIGDLMEKFEHGYNFAHGDNTQSLKWLRMAGIKDFECKDGWGFVPSPFVKFSWTREMEN